MWTKLAFRAFSVAALVASAGAATAQTSRYLTNDWLICELKVGGKQIDLLFTFRDFGADFKPNFKPSLGRPANAENSGDILNERKDGGRRTFTLRFKSGWERDFTITTDGRIVSSTSRRGTQTLTENIEGTCPMS
jgi:hypothetical protein